MALPVRPLFAVTLAAALATAAAVTVLRSPWVAPADAADQPSWCRPLIVVGARGTDEPVGLGAPVGATADRIRDELGDDVWVQPVDYPAGGDAAPDVWQQLADPSTLDSALESFGQSILPSIDAGADNVDYLLDAIDSHCSWAQVALVGYSQGATVIRAGLLKHGVNRPNYHVGLFGDPSLSSGTDGIIGIGALPTGGGYVPLLGPGIRGIQYSLTDTRGINRGQPRALPDDRDGRVDDLSICHVGDFLCDYSYAMGDRDDAGPDPHQTYPADAEAMADWLIDVAKQAR